MSQQPVVICQTPPSALSHPWSSSVAEVCTPARSSPPSANDTTLLPMSPRAASFTIRALLGLDSCKEHRRSKVAPYPISPVSDLCNKQVSSTTVSSSTLSSLAPKHHVNVPATTHQDIPSPAYHQDLPINTHQDVVSTGQKDVPVRVKRVRFTEAQLHRLEEEFERQQYLVGPKRRYLAEQLDLTEVQLKVWYQNKRIKWRKNLIGVDDRNTSSPATPTEESGQDKSNSPAA